MFVGVTAKKLVGGFFTGGTKFIQNFHKGEIYLIREKLCREKKLGENFYHLANMSSLFPDETFSLDTIKIFDLS